MESVSARTQRLRQLFLGLNNPRGRSKFRRDGKMPLLSTDVLLDALCIMYKEFDTLPRRANKNVVAFLNRCEFFISEQFWFTKKRILGGVLVAWVIHAAFLHSSRRVIQGRMFLLFLKTELNLNKTFHTITNKFHAKKHGKGSCPVIYWVWRLGGLA